jgi:hypothetical protein
MKSLPMVYGKVNAPVLLRQRVSESWRHLERGIIGEFHFQSYEGRPQDLKEKLDKKSTMHG